MSQETTAIKAKGVLITPFGSFSGFSEFLPSQCVITFSVTDNLRINTSLLSYTTGNRLFRLKEYFGPTLSCKTENTGTGIVTFYFFSVGKVILSENDSYISNLHIIGLVRSKCLCFLN